MSESEEQKGMYWGRVCKISHLKESAMSKPQQNIQPGFFEEGAFRNLPKAGESFILHSTEHFNSGIHTTPVVSVMIVDDIEGQDKLVLPQGFPSPETLHIPRFGVNAMKAGDILFATLNSLYWLSSIEKKK